MSLEKAHLEELDMIGVYFSGTGNTKYCVKRFLMEYEKGDTDKGKKAAENKVGVVSIEEKESVERIKNMDPAELLIFGYSVQFSNLPKIVHDYVVKNAALWKGKKVYVIATMGMFCGDGAGVLARLLEGYGADVIGGLHIRMANSNIDVRKKRTDEEIQILIKKAMKR